MPLSLTGHRLQLYGVFSTIMASAVIASAFHKHSNFYSATVFLSRSSASVMVLANYGGFLTLLFGRVVQQIFFGRLSTQEVERLYDRTWFFLTESLLAFTIFRDEFDAPFVVMFAALLFLKCFHWLIADRMDWMDQQPYPGPPWLFHIRTNIMFFILWTIDVLMLDFAIESVLTHGVGGIVLFGSEYAILLASCLNSMMKYGVMVYDLHRARSRGGENAPIWENKSMYLFYIELFTDFLKLTTYLAFFTIVMTFFGLPLNIIRDVYMTGVSFYTRFRDLLRYRAATKDMENRYPDASEEELSAMSDRTCIICREEMVPATRAQHQQQQQQPNAENGNDQPQPVQVQPPAPQEAENQLGAHDPPKKLPCGHVFHFQCLRSWLERQQSCPTCRRSVLENNNATPAANGAVPPPIPVAEGAAANQQGQAGANGNGAPPPPAPGAVPQPPPAPTGTATRRRAARGTGTATGRSRSPAGAQAQPRAFQGFSVAGRWHAWSPSPAQSTSPSDSAGASILNAPVADSGVISSNGITGVTPTGSGVATPLIESAILESASASVGTTPTRIASPLPPSATTTPPSSTVENNSSSNSNESTSQIPPEDSNDLTPRQAAAAAALRRLGGMAANLSPSPSPASTVTKSPSPIPTTSVAENGSSPVAGPSSSTSTPSIPTQNTATESTQPLADSRPPAPSASLPPLIPLFDPSSIAHRPFINLSNLGFQGFDVTPVQTPVVSRTYSASSLGSFPWSGVVSGGRHANTPAATATPTPSASFNSFSAPFPTSSTSNQHRPIPTPSSSLSLHNPDPFHPQIPPLQIPSVLSGFEAHQRTESIESLTREAIDERLRVIDEVQQSLFRAAEALRQVRDRPTDVKGKGRAVFNVIADRETSTPTEIEQRGLGGSALNTAAESNSASDSYADLGVPTDEESESPSNDVSPREVEVERQ